MRPVDVAAFRRDGFLVLPRFLDPRTVRDLRHAALAHFARGNGRAFGGGIVQDDLVESMPDVGWLLEHPEAVRVAEQLVGPRVVHPHQSGLHCGAVNRGWHKDNRDYMSKRDDPRDWRDDYRLVHFAYYLQDHVEQGGGIAFERGSHRAPGARGEVVVPAIRAGDLVVFDLRTSHFGNVIVRRSGRPLFLDPIWRSPRLRRIAFPLAEAIVPRLPVLFREEHGRDRLVVFFVYGADDEHTRDFLAWLRTQPDTPYLAGREGPRTVRAIERPHATR